MKNEIWRGKRYEIWRHAIYRRDLWKCAVCGIGGGKVEVHAHHLNSWASHPSIRYDMENGVCLCRKCHMKIHDAYGPLTVHQDFLDFQKSGGSSSIGSKARRRRIKKNRNASKRARRRAKAKTRVQRRVANQIEQIEQVENFERRAKIQAEKEWKLHINIFKELLGPQYGKEVFLEIRTNELASIYKKRKKKSARLPCKSTPERNPRP